MSQDNPFSETPWYDQRAAAERLRRGILIALLAHGLLLVGIGFIPEQDAPRARSLDVTLASFSDDDVPDQADFVAQANQLGSGEQHERSDTSTPLPSQFDAPTVQQQLQVSGAPAYAPEQSEQVVSSALSDWRLAAPDSLTAPSDTEFMPGEVLEPSNSNAEIASLIARLDEQQRAYARMPRVHRMTSVSARRSEDAAYLQEWKTRIERLGNQHYPPEARRRKLYGDLRMLVSLRPDGSVLQIRILQSSGYTVLDYAAMRIVRLAEPFPPFPPELREHTDVLEIIRTWQFRSNRLTSSD